jgi:hypothetical protein
MRPAFSFEGLLIEKAKVRLVNQRGTLQGVSWTLALQVIVRDLPQFLVDNRNQPFKGFLITRSPTNE